MDAIVEVTAVSRTKVSGVRYRGLSSWLMLYRGLWKEAVGLEH